MPHSAYNFRRESFLVALISGTETAWIRGGGSVKIFRRQFFCLTVPKIFVGESFTVAVFLDTGKTWIRSGGGGVSRFSVENFSSHNAEKIRRLTFLCSFSEKFR